MTEPTVEEMARKVNCDCGLSVQIKKSVSTNGKWTIEHDTVITFFQCAMCKKLFSPAEIRTKYAEMKGEKCQ